MRRLGSISDQTHAEHVTDYLLTLNVHARAEQEDGEWAVWVLDEEKLDEAREVFKELKESPNDERLKGIAQQATALREAEIQRRREAASNVVEMRGKWNTGTGRKIPITFTIIAICVGVFLLTGMKGSHENPMTRSLLFFNIERMVDGQLTFYSPLTFSAAIGNIVPGGQVWRLVTPIFLHGNIMHILMNLYGFYFLGRMFETVRGSRRFLAFVVFSAAFSNTLAILISSVRYGGEGIPGLIGISGVLCALFGYIWMKSSFDSSSGFQLSQTNIIMFIGFFFLCFFMPGISNEAHAAGLLFGVAVGYAPVLWKDLTGK